MEEEIRTDGESWIEPRAQDYDDKKEVEELMHGINESLTFTPVSIAVMTVSDTRTPETDTSGDILAQRLQDAGHHLAARCIVTDDKDKIAAQVQSWIDDPQIDVVISTGGTGLTGRDTTPELSRSLKKPLKDFRSFFIRSVFNRSACRRCNRGPSPDWPITLSFSPCPAPMVRSKMAGTKSSRFNSIAVTSHAIWSS